MERQAGNSLFSAAGSAGGGGSLRWTPALPPSAIAVIAQMAGVLGAGVLAVFFGSLGIRLPFPLLIFAVGVIAAASGRGLGLPAWWLPINLLFVPALAWGQSLAIAPQWFLAAFLGLLLIYGGGLRVRVPLYLSSRACADALSDLLPRQAGFSFADIGSGFGGLLFRVSTARPDGRYAGIETAPLPYWMSRLRSRFAGKTLRLKWGDFRKFDLGPYDVVYAFLSPVPMPALWQKAVSEMRPGSMLISNTFAIPGAAPDQVVEVDDRRHSRLYVYRIPHGGLPAGGLETVP